MKILKDRFQCAYIFKRKGSKTELVTLRINVGNPKRKTCIRVQLQKHNGILQQIQKFIKPPFSVQDAVTSNKLVKKCVRIDNNLLQALRREVGSNKDCISKAVSKAVLDKIESRVIDVIKTENFKHRITVRFTQAQYNLVRQTVDMLREQGVTGITFSLLVRSILYEHLGIVTEIDTEANNNVA